MRSPGVAREYLNDPRSADSFRDGWLRTGDVSVFAPDGSMRLTDRSKDLIKSGGEWISSVDPENALMAHPMVREATVIAIPDDTWLERPLACVEAHGTVTAEELRSYLLARFARYWVPDHIIFVRHIPKTSVGKFDKNNCARATSTSTSTSASTAYAHSDPAQLSRIIWTDDLPKTRSGKIMRRLLRDIAEDREPGEVTTLRDPSVLAQLRHSARAGQ